MLVYYSVRNLEANYLFLSLTFLYIDILGPSSFKTIFFKERESEKNSNSINKLFNQYSDTSLYH